MKPLIYLIFILFLLLFLKISVNAQAIIDIETGAVFNGYNDVRIPGDKGTLFSLNDDLKAKTKIFYRLRASYKIKSRHTISLLYAPLETKSEGSITNDIFFEGVIFPANIPLNGTYKFNSYRLTYRYDIVNKPKIVFGLGFTAKIRDARISLSSLDMAAEKTNVGFVPIINFNLFWKIDENTTNVPLAMFRLKFPSMSVIVPTVVPFANTLTPGSVWLFDASVTVPLMVTISVDCACKLEITITNKNPKKSFIRLDLSKLYNMICFILY